MLVAFAGTLTHCQFSSFEKLIQYQPLENWIDERIAGVDTTCHPLPFKVICIEELHACATNEHINIKEIKIVDNSFFIRKF